MPSHTKNRMSSFEVLLISVVWIVLISAPFLFGDAADDPSWRSISKPFESLIPLAVVFFVNRFLLVPFILFRGGAPNYLRYILSAVALILVATTAFFLISRQPAPGNFQPSPQQRQSQQSPHPPPPPQLGPSSNSSINPPPPGPEQRGPIPLYVNVLIFSILLVGFDTGLRLSVKLVGSEQEKVKLEKEKMETQLTILKNQVSPHFFMNTLNNIHALIDINTTEAKEAVIRLSNMMRYLLYETESGKTSLSSELEFVRSYVDLMKIRYSENVIINLNIPERIPKKQIPPFLFTSLIENAFKHGISYKAKSFVIVDIAIDDNRLLLAVKNSIASQGIKDSPSGIGIDNTRKRLDLLYGDKYHLDILNDGTEFNVNLSIPI